MFRRKGTLKDTVPLLESKVSISKVSRADVDVSNFSKASASSKMVSVTLTKSAGTTTTEPTTPTTPTEPGNGDHSGGPIEPGKMITKVTGIIPADQPHQNSRQNQPHRGLLLKVVPPVLIQKIMQLRPAMVRVHLSRA